MRGRYESFFLLLCSSCCLHYSENKGISKSCHASSHNTRNEKHTWAQATLVVVWAFCIYLAGLFVALLHCRGGLRQRRSGSKKLKTTTEI